MKRMAQVSVVLVVSAPARKKSSQMLTSWSTQKDEVLSEFCLKKHSYENGLSSLYCLIYILPLRPKETYF